MSRDREASIVELSIGGRRLRVTATADSGELESLAEDVSARMERIGGRGRNEADVLALVALELAHELRDARSARAALLERAVAGVSGAVSALDVALGEGDRHEPLIRAVREAVASAVLTARGDGEPAVLANGAASGAANGAATGASQLGASQAGVSGGGVAGKGAGRVDGERPTAPRRARSPRVSKGASS